MVSVSLLIDRRRQWHPTPVLLPGKSHGRRSLVGCSPAKSRTQLNNFTFTFHFHALKKEMATYSSVLAWRVPGTGEPGGLPSVGSHRVGQDWSNLAAAATQLITQWYLLSTFCVKRLYYSCNTKISTQRRLLNLKLQKVRECFLTSFREDVSCLSEIFKDLQLAHNSEWLLYRFVINLQMLRYFVKRTNICK